MRKLSVIRPGVLVLLVLASAWVLPVAGQTVATMPAALPSGRGATSAIWDGTNAYIFGGEGGYDAQGQATLFDEILRYNPATDTVTTMGARLPTARSGTSAIWDGTNAYIFGGYEEMPDGNRSATNQVLRYNPATDVVTVMSATLGSARSQTSAVWDGTFVHIFGGVRDGLDLNRIERYNPATDQFSTRGPGLPSPRFETSAVWDGRHAYIFGGSHFPADGGSVALSEIVKYDPVADVVSTMTASFPTPRGGTSAVWDGTNAYIFGGPHPEQKLSQGNPNEITRFNPTAGTVTTLSVALPTARFGASAVWAGSNAFVFGANGIDGPGGVVDDILRFTPAAGPAAPKPSEPAPVTVDQTVTAGASGTASLAFEGHATLSIQGLPGASMRVKGTVASAPDQLPVAQVPLKQDGFTGGRYLQFDAQVTSGSVPQISITVNLATLGLPSHINEPAELRFYYWNGARWSPLQVGTIAGEGLPDLQVFSVRVDLAAGTMTASVNHLSSYAIGIQDETAPAPVGASIPLFAWLALGGAVALTVLAFVARAAVRRARQPPKPLPPSQMRAAPAAASRTTLSAPATPPQPLKCPRCGTMVPRVPGEKPVCPKCWYGA